VEAAERTAAEGSSGEHAAGEVLRAQLQAAERAAAEWKEKCGKAVKKGKAIDTERLKATAELQRQKAEVEAAATEAVGFLVDAKRLLGVCDDVCGPALVGGTRTLLVTDRSVLEHVRVRGLKQRDVLQNTPIGRGA
jgi:hypothetical protein